MPPSPAMVQALGAQKGNYKPPKARDAETGVVEGHDDYVELWYIDHDSAAPPTDGLPRMVIKPWKIAVDVDETVFDNNPRIVQPGQLFRTRGSAQAKINAMYRAMFRREIGGILERLVLAGFEQGVCEDPETTLAGALQAYLKDTTP
jgi:hypothetical protein